MHPSALGFSLAALPLALAATLHVAVGPNGNLVYDPPFVTAAVGDIVSFTFNPKNHTVTQSNFDTPCTLNGGSNSGFKPVAPGTTDLPTFEVTVQDTKPLWFYCQQTLPRPHCGAGMVFAINPPPEGDPHSFSAFKALALATAANATSTATDTFPTPPPQSWGTATATVTSSSSVWTSTYTSYDGTPPPTYAPQPVDHKITVGADGKLAFNPSNISAAIGDTVTFEFRPKNHTVTQSSFNDPCRPLADTSKTGQTGFNSGFNFFVAPDATSFPVFTIKINDTAPIWGYCQQSQPSSHCGAGMVFSINAVESGANNFANFQALAKRINGTATAPTTSTSSTPTPGSSGPNGALSVTGTSYGPMIGLGVVAFVASLI